MRLITILTFILAFLLMGCASKPVYEHDFSGVGEPVRKDYVDQLASMGRVYLRSEDISEIKLKHESVKYLEQVYERIITNNEILFKRDGKPTFHIIKSKTPFIFSLPGAQFFISSSLMEKYLKSEELFVAALAAEILKSDRHIYEKRIAIPVGYLSTERMIQITRVAQETKFQINEWSYFVLKRSGYDASAFLNWIQVQNRNTLDFSMFLGDAVGISKEEHLFKNFMAKQGIASIEKKINEANSSKAFYNLLNNIVRTR